MLLVQLLWLRSIYVIACRVNKHYCNFPKSAADTLALLYEWGCNKPLCCTVLYSDTIKSRASVELTAVKCWKLYFVVYYIIYCDTCLCSQADTVSCCLASLDFLWGFFYFRRLIHLYQHVYSCGVVVWSSTDFFADKRSLFFRNSSFLWTWIQLLFSELTTLSNMLLCCRLRLKSGKQKSFRRFEFSDSAQIGWNSLYSAVTTSSCLV